MKSNILSIVSIVLFSIQLSLAQEVESFDNYTGGDEVRSGSFTGANNVTWNYVNCRGDKDRQLVLVTENSTKGFKSYAQQFCQQGALVVQTDQYVAPPDSAKNGGVEPPVEWHVTASYGPTLKTRILTVIQVTPGSASPISIIKQGDGDFQLGDWRILAELNGNNPARLDLRNDVLNVSFSLGTQTVVINGGEYLRKNSGSSVLYDEINGTKQVMEVIDRPAQPTR